MFFCAPSQTTYNTKMKSTTKRLKQAACALCSILCLASSALSAQGIEGNIDDVARAILTYFPKVTGKVTATHQNEIEVQIQSGQGLSEGVLLSVFREEEAFHHPVTNVPLGRFEGHVGIIEVIRFEAPRLIAKSIDPLIKIEVGDLVRLPSTKIPVAISTRSKNDHAFLQNELAAALLDTGRFQIDPLSPGTDMNTALNQKNRYYIELTTDRVDGVFSMHLQLQNTATGTQLANLDVMIHQSEQSDLILENLQFKLFEQRQKSNSND